MSQPIFLYWHQGWDDVPEVVKACRNSWESHHRDSTTFKIVPLCNQTVEQWLEPCADDDRQKLEFFRWRLENTTQAGSLAFYTDYLRLILTETHGGFWIDATVYCLRPFDTWLTPADAAMMPLSISPDRLFEVWFIDNRAKDPLITQWKNQLGEPHFARRGYTRYIDDWSTKPYQFSHWLFKLSRRSWILSGMLWNSTLTSKWLRIRPYFMVNYALHKVITSGGHFKSRFIHILPIDLGALMGLEMFDEIQNPEKATELIARAPFIKLSHKKDWGAINKHGLSIKKVLQG